MKNQSQVFLRHYTETDLACLVWQHFSASICQASGILLRVVDSRVSADCAAPSTISSTLSLMSDEREEKLGFTLAGAHKVTDGWRLLGSYITRSGILHEMLDTLKSLEGACSIRLESNDNTELTSLRGSLLDTLESLEAKKMVPFWLPWMQLMFAFGLVVLRSQESCPGYLGKTRWIHCLF